MKTENQLAVGVHTLIAITTGYRKIVMSQQLQYILNQQAEVLQI